MARTFTKAFAGIACLLFMIIVAGCGNSSTSSSGTPSVTNAQGNRSQRPQAITGTIQQYNSSSKSLTIKEADGTTRTFSLDKARIVKSEKISQQQLSTLLGSSGMIVRVMGQRTGTNAINAQTLIVSQANAGVANGTPPAGAPPAGANGTPPANGAPAGGDASLILRNGKLQNNRLVGTNRAGKSITVALSSTTTIIQQTPGADSDLQSGQTVSVMTARDSTSDARVVVVGDLAQMPGN